MTSPEVAGYGINKEKIAVGGTSAGGTLAVGIALRLRDEVGDTSAIKLLILDDASYTDNPNSYSTSHNPVNKIWNANVTRYMWQIYLPQGSDALEPRIRGYAVPAREKDISKLPPTLILCAQWDDLTNDAIMFAHRLLENGVPTEIHVSPAQSHM